MARGGLSFEARELLRTAAREEYKADGIYIGDTAARRELEQLGYITRGSRAERWEVTVAGIHAVARIIRDSGDGPEALKAMFAPMIRPTR